MPGAWSDSTDTTSSLANSLSFPHFFIFAETPFKEDQEEGRREGEEPRKKHAIRKQDQIYPESPIRESNALGSPIF